MAETRSYDKSKALTRIIAAFFVVMIHASATGSDAAILYNSVSRFSVPVFVILSGYFMLARERTGKEIAKKCAALLLKMLAWSGIYYLYGFFFDGYKYTGAGSLIGYLISEPVHLWYCYATVALYIFTPLFFVFAKGASKKDYRYALALTFIFGSVLLILVRSGRAFYLETILDKMKLPYALGFVCLYLFGGYFRKFGATHRLVLYILGILGTAATYLGTVRIKETDMPHDLLLSFFAPGAILAGAAFFVFTESVFRRLGGTGRLLKAISDCTLGIYLLHPLVLMIIDRLGISGDPYWLIPTKAAAAFIISLALIFAIKKIPIVKLLA